VKIFRFLLNVVVNIRYYIFEFGLALVPRVEYSTFRMITTWNSLFKLAKPRHWLLGLLSAVITLITAYALVQTDWGHYSLLTGIIALIELALSGITGSSITLPFPFLMIVLVLLIFSKGPVMRLPYSAMLFGSGLPLLAAREEVLFRYGSERRSLPGTFVAQMAFGLMHFSNIIYPIGVCLALTVPGLLFTLVYIRSHRKYRSEVWALYESTFVHTIHNIMALLYLVGILIFIGAQIWLSVL
jgi:uncharacterized membrane protein